MPPTMWFGIKVPQKNRPTKEQWDRIEYFNTRDKILGISESIKFNKKYHRTPCKKSLKRKKTPFEVINLQQLLNNLIQHLEDKTKMPPPSPILLPGSLKRCDALPYKKQKI